MVKMSNLLQYYGIMVKLMGSFQKILACYLIYRAETFDLNVMHYGFQQLRQSSDADVMNVE